MSTLVIPDLVQSMIDNAVREEGYTDSSAYVAALIARDLARRRQLRLHEHLRNGPPLLAHLGYATRNWEEIAPHAESFVNAVIEGRQSFLLTASGKPALGLVQADALHRIRRWLLCLEDLLIGLAKDAGGRTAPAE